MKTFLRFESRGDKDNRATRKKVPHERGQKRLRGWADACAGDSASLLQSPLQGLHGGSLRAGGKKLVCRRPYRISCQARPTSHGHGRGVKRRWEMSNDEPDEPRQKRTRRDRHGSERGTTGGAIGAVGGQSRSPRRGLLAAGNCGVAT